MVDSYVVFCVSIAALFFVSSSAGYASDSYKDDWTDADA